jgi:hypothetical protein
MCVAISAGHCDRHFCAGTFFLFLIKGIKHLEEDGFCPCEQLATHYSERQRMVTAPLRE